MAVNRSLRGAVALPAAPASVDKSPCCWERIVVFFQKRCNMKKKTPLGKKGSNTYIYIYIELACRLVAVEVKAFSFELLVLKQLKHPD